MAKRKSQVEKFREAAREAETDDSEDRFNTALKDMARSPREAKQEGQKKRDDADKTSCRPSAVQKPKSSWSGD